MRNERVSYYTLFRSGDRKRREFKEEVDTGITISKPKKGGSYIYI